MTVSGWRYDCSYSTRVSPIEALLKCVKDADGQEAERRGKQKSKAKVNKVEENSCEFTDQIKQLQADLAALKAQKEAPPA